MIQLSQYICTGPRLDTQDMVGYDIALDLQVGYWGDTSPLKTMLLLERAEVHPYCHPLGMILPPTIQEINEGVTFLRAFESAKQRIYMHCHTGVDRTGMVRAGYRILIQGWSPWKAAVECIRAGMHPWYYFWLIQLWRLGK